MTGWARVMDPFSFFYSLKKNWKNWSPCFLFITEWFSLGTSGETTSRRTLVFSMICKDCFVYWCYSYSYFIMTIDQQNVGTFSVETCSWSAFILLTHLVSLSFVWLFNFLSSFPQLLAVSCAFSDAVNTAYRE